MKNKIFILLYLMLLSNCSNDSANKKENIRVNNEANKVADEKAAKAKRLAEERVAEEKRLAEEKAAEAKRLVEEQKRIADQDKSKEEGEYKDGEKDGLWTIYNKKGLKEKEITYDLGIELKQTIYNDEGLKEKEILYEKDEEEIHTLFNENGTKVKEGKIVDGKEEGVWTTFDEKGKKKEETTFKDGEEDGLYSLWYENGLKKAEGPNKGKCRIGLWTWYYESGEIDKEINYSDNGCNTRDGISTVYNKNGKKLEEIVYINGSFESRKKY